jgi:hypothetical protein
MDPDLIDELEGPAPLGVHLVTVTLPGDTIRWTDGGFVVWDAQTYREVDAAFGTLSELEAVEDGAGDQATSWAMTIMPPIAAVTDLAAEEAQGSLITLHLGAVDRATGLLVGEPELLQRVELDVASLGVSADLTVNLECITEEARMLEPNEERIQSDAFHQKVWPGELHYEFQTRAKIKVYWRADDPNNAL